MFVDDRHYLVEPALSDALDLTQVGSQAIIINAVRFFLGSLIALIKDISDEILHFGTVH